MSADLDGVLDDAGLFDIERPPPVSLADKFVVPPMSVLDRRAGAWQERKRRWLSLGMQSELGRDAAAVGITQDGRDDFIARLLRGESESDAPRTIGAMVADGVSVFDPVICELVYRWLTPVGGCILDPFAGGSVRGLVASTLARWYVGVDLSARQVAANQAQAGLGSDIAPRWLCGDSQDLDAVLDDTGDFDLVFSCPPYADLERYSDDPRDLSAMGYEDFLAAYRQVIADATRRLRPDRFAAWVISDVRDRRGNYRNLVGATVTAFADAGLPLYNDAIVLDHVGAAALRAERSFTTTRKLTRVHQHLLIFVKGDGRRAAQQVAA